MPQVFVNNLIKRIENGCIGHLSKKPKREISIGELPFEMTLVDPVSKEEVLAAIISYVPINGLIPDVFALISENKSPFECELDVLTRCDVQSVNELAFYVYKKI